MMMQPIIIITSVLTVILSLTNALHVEDRVLRSLDEKKTINVLIRLKEKPHVVRKLQSSGKVTARRLFEAATEHQKDFVARFGTMEGIQLRSYYIDNVVAVDDVSMELFEEMKQHEDVDSIFLNEVIITGSEPKGSEIPFFHPNNMDDRQLSVDSEIHTPRELTTTTSTTSQPEYPLYVKTSGAACLRKLGFNGTGIVVGFSGTGANVDHDGLRRSYRGYIDDGEYGPNYNWYDAFGQGLPVDARFVGTHITGVAVSVKNRIGIAPGAKFIACRSIDELERDTPESQIQCLEFFFAPFPVNGNRTLAREDKRPHIIYTQYSDSSFDNVLKPAIQRLIDAGVVVVTNAGPREENSLVCAKQLRDPSYYPEVLTVGALTEYRRLLSTSAGGPIFSSNGTIQTDITKPDIVAHGSKVVSAVYLDRKSVYFPASGTPVAAAVVVGAVAVLMSALPHLANRTPGIQNTIMSLLQQTARPMLSKDCSSPLAHPNNVFGYGEINVAAAYRELVEENNTTTVTELNRVCGYP